MGIGEMFEFEKTGRFDPEPTLFQNLNDAIISDKETMDFKEKAELLFEYNDPSLGIIRWYRDKNNRILIDK